MSNPSPATGSAGRRPRTPIRRVAVESVERITPRLTRIVFQGEELAGFGPPRPASHIKLVLVPDGSPWTPAHDVEPRPLRRTYTPRRFDPERLRLEVEFVHHGDGVAARWAEQAAPGQPMYVSGPGGGWELPAETGPVILVADETALPAVGMILDSAPADRRITVVAEVADAGERRTLSDSAGYDPIWVQRDGGRPGAPTGLEAAIRTLSGTANAWWWIACEAGAMRRIRQHLLKEAGVAPARLHTRGYWKLGATAYPDHDYGND